MLGLDITEALSYNRSLPQDEDQTSVSFSEAEGNDTGG